MRVSIILIGLGLTLGFATSVRAVDPGVKCEADKLKEVGKYSSCRLKAESKSVKNGLPPDFTKCDQRYDARWTRIEARAEAEESGSCPSFRDAADIGRMAPETPLGELIKDEVQECVDTIKGIVSGTPPPPVCSLPATGQMTCREPGGQVLTCAGTGHDGEIQAGAALSYLDNGDGTITDLNTGLMWEKKSDDGSIHDRDTLYTWDDAFAVHVAGLNTASFAGHTDWRVPNAKELQSIVDYGTSNPSVDPVFDNGCGAGCPVTTCSCTATSVYWSSSDGVGGPGFAWVVRFLDGNVVFNGKHLFDRVRAVRGGL